MSCFDCGKIISTSDIINSLFNCGETLSFQATGYKTTGQIQLFHFPKRGQIWQHIHPHITWKMVVLSYKTHFGGIKMFGNSCSNLGLKNILPITKHLASRKDVSVDFFSLFCQQPLHTFRIKVTKMKKKYYGIHQMDQQERYVLSQFCKRDPWVASISIHTIHRS